MEKDVLKSMLGGDEDSREKVLNELTPEENKLALEILEEEIDATPNEDTPSKSEEPEKEIPDTSDDKVVEDEKVNDDESHKVEDDIKKDDEEFSLTNELIEQQPEENREILSKYVDKSKEDLAQAAANAVALKSPHLKGNEKVIAVMKEQYLEKTPDELISILVDTQKEVGKKDVQEPEAKVKEIELPEIPEDDPEMNKILESETLKRLKKTYPNMPMVDSMESEDFKEWVRDLNVDKPLNKLKEDINRETGSVKEELSKIIYIQKNLPNLYVESPNEVLPLFTKEGLPRLKALNDNPMEVLVQDLTKEIQTIESGLKTKYNLTLKDLGVDLTITRDEKGTPTNKTLNDLITVGKTSDGRAIPSNEIIGEHGKTFWLKPGTLARKFKDEFEHKILNAVVEKKTITDKTRKEKLKSETLTTVFSTGKGGKKVMTIEDIEKLSPEENKQLLAHLENSI